MKLKPRPNSFNALEINPFMGANILIAFMIVLMISTKSFYLSVLVYASIQGVTWWVCHRGWSRIAGLTQGLWTITYVTLHVLFYFVVQPNIQTYSEFEALQAQSTEGFQIIAMPVPPAEIFAAWTHAILVLAMLFMMGWTAIVLWKKRR